MTPKAASPASSAKEWKCRTFTRGDDDTRRWGGAQPVHQSACPPAFRIATRIAAFHQMKTFQGRLK